MIKRDDSLFFLFWARLIKDLVWSATDSKHIFPVWPESLHARFFNVLDQGFHDGRIQRALADILLLMHVILDFLVASWIRHQKFVLFWIVFDCSLGIITLIVVWFPSSRICARLSQIGNGDQPTFFVRTLSKLHLMNCTRGFISKFGWIYLFIKLINATLSCQRFTTRIWVTGRHFRFVVSICTALLLSGGNYILAFLFATLNDHNII